MMNSDEQTKAIAMAVNHRKGRNPYWWLKERNWDVSEVKKELRVLSGIEADMAKAQGVSVVVAKLPNGKYGTVLRQDAEVWGLKVLREF